MANSDIMRLFTFLTLVLLLTHCSSERGIPSHSKLFELIPEEVSGVYFSNPIKEDFQNFFGVFNYVYNGGGVAIGDINNDGLADLFFSANDAPNKLYLNLGDFKFKDITENAGILAPKGWDNGVVMVDVNEDGWMDIYIARGGWKDLEGDRRNLLYINKGNLTFEEQAQQYGLDDTGYSLQASFFDMDNDQDLDMYLTNRPDRFFLNYKKVLEGKKSQNDSYRDKLYRNDRNTFTEVGLSSGITNNFGYGLGLITSDINSDGYTDIYVANDYLENDYLYINQGNGTFKEQIKSYTNHVPFYSMGIDIVDINNDGWEDIIQLDMLPADYKRSKTTMASMNVELFDDLIHNGFHYQYMHNMLQLNRGNNFFSEIGQLAGISKTDWSWACLGSDFDNDGYRDIFITNGFKRDIWDKDIQKEYVQFLNSSQRRQQSDEENARHIIDMFPTNKIENYVFHNNGDLTFTNKTKEWGLDQKSLSNGAAVGDLDNDGDLDLVVNNVDGHAFIYKNMAETLNNNYLKIRLKGPKSNPYGHGAKIRLFYGDEIQYQEFKTVRGYLSSVEPVVHFGLNEVKSVDSIEVVWQDLKVNKLNEISSNQTIDINYQDALINDIEVIPPTPLLNDVTDSHFNAPFFHQENDFDDYRVQVLLPHQLSKLGPCIAVADVNLDGLEDFFVGGAHKQAGQIYIQNQHQQFQPSKNNDFTTEIQLEDTGASFFDADNDGDLDLYVVSGGNEFQPASSFFQDRLYFNDGKGNFQLSEALPEINSSGSCVRPYDFDQDGDLDIFVGGRLIPFNYPNAPKSYLLENIEGHFKNVTHQKGQSFENIGMVTDAVWADIDSDNLAELIIVGEWMPISIFKLRNGSFENITQNYQLENTTGWWNNIQATDIDQDGDFDLVVGNLGLNYKFKASSEKPFTVFADDFDKNGTNDIFLAKYDEGRIVPIRGKECSSQQVPSLNKKFPSFKKFADADLHQILDGKTRQALKYEARLFSSVLLENNNGTFQIRKLPLEAQVSTINGIVPKDFNNDGKIDLLMAGNNFNTEVETTRADGSPGILLVQQDDHTFKSKSPIESGFFVPYNVKALEEIKLGKNGAIGILVGVNDGKLILYKSQRTPALNY